MQPDNLSRETIKRLYLEQVKTITDIISHAIDAVKPERFIPANISLDGTVLTCCGRAYDLAETGNIYVVGFGKVSIAMAVEVEKLLTGRIAGGVIITNQKSNEQLSRITVMTGDHPLIGLNSITASRALLDILVGLNENDLVLCLISGGGSAMFELLPGDVSLEEVRELNHVLLRSGASIDEINIVRQSVSLVKGGKLLDYIFPAQCISLILSDVVGDPVAYIASGPTYLPANSGKSALDILIKYNLLASITMKLLKHIQMQVGEELPSRAVAIEYYKKSVFNCIIANNSMAVEAVGQYCQNLGLETIIHSTSLNGEAREVAKTLAGIIDGTHLRKGNNTRPVCIIAGGETTVVVIGTGTGGRNQELALSTMMELQNSEASYIFVSCGTDGIDGMTKVAGGIVSDYTFNIAREMNLLPETFLENNDAFHFLERVEGLFVIPPNQTNVMDIVVALVY